MRFEAIALTINDQKVVQLSKADLEGIQETLYLQSIPNLVKSIREAERTDDWVFEDKFLRALNGLED
ncbi:RelB/StbD replicon stabilization protein [Pseudanabaena sp. lw0831]|nr:RelB/StbD replicon stabilization protein [Pseudanabaena sp. lw0831]